MFYRKKQNNKNRKDPKLFKLLLCLGNNDIVLFETVMGILSIKQKSNSVNVKIKILIQQIKRFKCKISKVSLTIAARSLFFNVLVIDKCFSY